MKLALNLDSNPTLTRLKLKLPKNYIYIYIYKLINPTLTLSFHSATPSHFPHSPLPLSLSLTHPQDLSLPTITQSHHQPSTILFSHTLSFSLKAPTNFQFFLLALSIQIQKKKKKFQTLNHVQRIVSPSFSLTFFYFFQRLFV